MKLKNYKNMDQVEIDNILNNYDEIYLKEIVPEGTEIKEYENEDELIKEEEEGLIYIFIIILLFVLFIYLFIYLFII